MKVVIIRRITMISCGVLARTSKLHSVLIPCKFVDRKAILTYFSQNNDLNLCVQNITIQILLEEVRNGVLERCGLSQSIEVSHYHS